MELNRYLIQAPPSLGGNIHVTATPQDARRYAIEYADESGERVAYHRTDAPLLPRMYAYPAR